VRKWPAWHRSSSAEPKTGETVKNLCRPHPDTRPKLRPLPLCVQEPQAPTLNCIAIVPVGPRSWNLVTGFEQRVSTELSFSLPHLLLVGIGRSAGRPGEIPRPGAWRQRSISVPI
jgi:hypothetical protein